MLLLNSNIFGLLGIVMYYPRLRDVATASLAASLLLPYSRDMEINEVAYKFISEGNCCFVDELLGILLRDIQHVYDV